MISTRPVGSYDDRSMFQQQKKHRLRDRVIGTDKKLKRIHLAFLIF